MWQYPYMNKIVYVKGTQGTETSKYLEEKKVITISLVVVSECERAQTEEIRFDGVRTVYVKKVWYPNTTGKLDNIE